MRDWSKAEWVDPKYDWKPLPVPEMPDRLLIDYATRCNLRCHMCPVWGLEDDNAIDNVKGIMNLDVVRTGIVFENGTFPDMVEPPKRVPCAVIYKTMPVHNDGSVRLCCLDGVRATDMGNVFENSVQEIWHGEEFAKARYYHETAQWDKVPFCKGCNGWAQYEYTEEVKDGLLIRRSPEYVYYNLINRLSTWKGNLLGGHKPPPEGL